MKIFSTNDKLIPNQNKDGSYNLKASSKELILGYNSKIIDTGVAIKLSKNKCALLTNDNKLINEGIFIPSIIIKNGELIKIKLFNFSSMSFTIEKYSNIASFIIMDIKDWKLQSVSNVDKLNEKH